MTKLIHKRVGFSVLTAMTTLVFLAGCASYSAASLNSLETALVGISSTDSVLATSKVFNKADCKRFLDRNVIGKGYQPVQVYIKNNSDKSYLFSLSRVSLPCVASEEVAKRVHTSTVGRAVGYGVASLFVWPMIVPAIVDGIKSAEANEHLDYDFAAKTARDQMILPHSNMNTVLFVPVNNFQEAFTITLIEEGTGKTKEITLGQNS